MSEGRVEKVIMKGEGLLRQPSGKVCFIPYVLPGETIRYNLVKERKDFDEATLEEVIQSHPLRQAPKCPHFAHCQGCQLQQAPIELQRELKGSWLIEQFTRTCKQTPPILPEMEDLEAWYYRRVVDFHWEVHEGKGCLGYRNSKGLLIEVSTCEIVKGGRDTVEKAKRFMQATGITKARLRYIHTKTKLAVIELSSKEGCESLIQQLDSLWPYPELDGLFLTYKFETLLHLGKDQIEENIAGLSIAWHGLGFLQNHFEGSVSFYRWLEEKMLEDIDSTKALWLDLYCGTGVTALMAARAGWKVRGMEISAPAVEIARANAKRNKLSQVQFEVQDLNKGISSKLMQEKIGGILVNPPRTGISKPLINSISRSKCPRLLYLSCDPVTLCRDLKHFLDHGFCLKAWKAFDCFAQTSHFETAVWLERN